MKTFLEINNEETIKVKFPKEKEYLIQQFGGEKNYNIILESIQRDHGVLNEEDTFNMLGSFLGSFKNAFDDIDKEVWTSIVAGVLSPIAEKIGIKKGTIFWYMFTYGSQSVMKEIGWNFWDRKKKDAWCKAFAIGVAKSSEYWLTSKVTKKIFNMLGFNPDRADNAITRTITNTLRNNLLEQINANNVTSNLLINLVCTEKIAKVDGVDCTLFELLRGAVDFSNMKIVKDVQGKP